MVQFGCMHKIFKQVMSIIDKKKLEGLSRDESSLTKQEIEVLLNMIRTTSFLGEHVESVYNMVIKLQKQYLNIKD
jgi:hypothetical protein